LAGPVRPGSPSARKKKRELYGQKPPCA
jgi:hypothetical protein